jgi:amidase
MTGLRLGVDERYLTVGVHPEVSQAVLAAVEVLKAQGAEMVAVTVPELAHDATGRAWYTITAADALVAHAGFYPERAADYGPFRELLEDGTRYSAQAYAQAHQVREELRGRFQGLFENVDVVLCPTMPSTAPRMDAQGNARMAEGLVRTRYTFPWNFSRHPTLSLPCGFDSEGMPVSLQAASEAKTGTNAWGGSASETEPSHSPKRVRLRSAPGCLSSDCAAPVVQCVRIHDVLIR